MAKQQQQQQAAGSALKLSIPPDLLAKVRAETQAINANPETLRPVRHADIVLAALRERYRDQESA